jgi:3-oxoadipate enol-lactonase
MRRQSAAAFCGAQGAMAQRRDQSDLLPMLRVPTLFVAGSADILTPPALVRGMAERTPGSQFVEIPSAGHQSNLENPAAVNAALLGFLARLP